MIFNKVDTELLAIIFSKMRLWMISQHELLNANINELIRTKNDLNPNNSLSLGKYINKTIFKRANFYED